jgi:hypothetical protein
MYDATSKNGIGVFGFVGRSEFVIFLAAYLCRQGEQRRLSGADDV